MPTPQHIFNVNEPNLIEYFVVNGVTKVGIPGVDVSVSIAKESDGIVIYGPQVLADDGGGSYSVISGPTVFTVNGVRYIMTFTLTGLVTATVLGKAVSQINYV